MTPRWRQADDAVSRRLPDGVLVMALAAGEPVTITGPGFELWEHLAAPSTFEEIVSTLAARFATDEAVVRDDLHGLLDDMQERRLIVREPSLPPTPNPAEQP